MPPGAHSLLFDVAMSILSRPELKIAHNHCAGKILPFISTLVIFLFATAIGQAETNGDRTTDLRLPERFGEVIYQEHGERDNRIYIVAQSHRSAINGQENGDCQKVQAEIYRIGEWLIVNEKVEALLPEGYFGNSGPDADHRRPRPGEKPGQPTRLDDATLTARLSNSSIFVNADRLLYSTYDLSLRQIEDRKLYFTVVDELRSLLSDDSPQQQTNPTVLPILAYHQKKRSAVILENIPEALSGKKSTDGGNIRRAMLTIGLAHVDTMIDFLESGQAQILPPPGMEDVLQQFTCDLGLLKEGYAIAVIIPRTLADSRRTFLLSRLSGSQAPNL